MVWWSGGSKQRAISHENGLFQAVKTSSPLSYLDHRQPRTSQPGVPGWEEQALNCSVKHLAMAVSRSLSSKLIKKPFANTWYRHSRSLLVCWLGSNGCKGKMWEWKLAVWWDRDNKGRAREKFANSKIEARSVEHGKLLPPSIFCYYQASGHRPIGSVASSRVEVLCFDLNYQSFRYLFWTGKDPRNLINKCSGFSTCIGWSSEGRLWMFYFYPKLEHRQQPIFRC